ncbi:MAG: hypothetical protein MOB07_03680 [Acidobacteria bacterium]|nr:hypothetical protein [Acidobacteriota bacterium]
MTTNSSPRRQRANPSSAPPERNWKTALLRHTTPKCSRTRIRLAVNRKAVVGRRLSSAVATNLSNGFTGWFRQLLSAICFDNAPLADSPIEQEIF